jgi:hypothetical protein
MSNQSRKRNIWGSFLEAVLFGGIFLAIGGGISFWGWNILQNAKASSSWPTAQGNVISSDVSYSSNADGGESYSPEVIYQYTVNDQHYESHTIKFGENSYSSRRKAEGIASSYPVGKEVTVYYDPQNPERSVLEPGVSGGSYIVLGIGVLFGLIGLVAVPLVVIFRQLWGQ